MQILKITSQNRRDFTAEYKCEHCGHTVTGSGYDDQYFHEEVIPKMVCVECGKVADDTYVAKETKYPQGQQV